MSKKAIPMIYGLPADYRRPDDLNCTLTIQCVGRVKDAFIAMKKEYEGIPSWAALAILLDAYEKLEIIDATISAQEIK